MTYIENKMWPSWIGGGGSWHRGDILGKIKCSFKLTLNIIDKT